MKLPLSRVAEFLSATGEFDHKAIAQAYSIDSRTIQPGELFFAVKGERMDGHDFVQQALEKGAVAAVVRKDELARYAVKTGLLAVPDTLVALQTLGAAVRRLWAKPLIGVTGSTGKTTTKEAIAHVLSSRFRVLKSEGNFNNHFGLPLMLLKIEPEHEAAVIEMGMSHRGEIAALAKIAQPEIGVVTNVAPVHLEFFKSVAEIARAKYELIESLPAGGTAILNADDEYVSQFGRDFHGKVVRYGLHPSADVRAENIESRGAAGSVFDVVAGGCRERATLPLVGTHNIYNALAAVATGMERGLSPSEATRALATLAPRTNGGRSSKWATSRSSTIVTIPIQRPWTRWWTRWPPCRRSGASWSRARCWNWGRRAKNCIAARASTWRRRESTYWSGCEAWRSRWSKPQAAPASGQNSWPRPRKPASGWRAKPARVMWCCSKRHAA